MTEKTVTAVVKSIEKENNIQKWVLQAEKGLKVRDLDTMEKAVDPFMYVFTMIGLPPGSIPKGAVMANILDYTKKNLPQFTLEDIKVAFTLFIQNRMDYQPSKEGIFNFSGYLLENVMQSYSRYRFNIIKAEKEQAEDKKDVEKVKRMTVGEWKEMLKDTVRASYARYLEKDSFVDARGMTYKALEMCGVITLTVEEKTEIRRIALIKLKADLQYRRNVEFNCFSGDVERQAGMYEALLQYFNHLDFNHIDLETELKKIDEAPIVFDTADQGKQQPEGDRIQTNHDTDNQPSKDQGKNHGEEAKEAQ